MNKILVSILLCLFVFGANAQTDTMVYETVEKMPSYIGGEEARQKFIAENLVYPDSALKYEKQGTIIVELIVELDSSVSDVKAARSFDDYCAVEAVRLVKMMKWIPAENNAKKVRLKVYTPVRFKLP